VLHERPSIPFRVRGASRQAVSVTRPLEPSWCHRPLQSLVGWQGSEPTGCSPPVRPVRSRRTAHPVFPAPPAPGDATHRVLLSWGSIPSTVFPEVPARNLSVSRHSPGVLSPTAHWVARVHGLAGCPVRHPRLSLGVSSTVPPADYGAAHRFSQPLSDFFLSRPVHLFQMAGAPGVVPSKGLFLPRSPTSSSPVACLLDVPPKGCAAPV